jgi:hypothetical protein
MQASKTLLALALAGTGAISSQVFAATLSHPALRVRQSSFDVYHPPSSAAALYNDVIAYCVALEARIDSGQLHRPVQTYEVQPLPPLPEGVKLTKEQERARRARALEPREIAPVPREELAEEQQLLLYFNDVVALRSQLPFPGYMEVRHLDGARAHLASAYSKLRLALGEPAYASLEGDHAAWMAYYFQLLQREQYAQAIEYMRADEKLAPEADEKLAPEDALARAQAAIPSIPLPPMDLDREYPIVDIPALIAGAGGAAIYGDESNRFGGAVEADTIDAEQGTSIESVAAPIEGQPASSEAEPSAGEEPSASEEPAAAEEPPAAETDVMEAPEEVVEAEVVEPTPVMDDEPAVEVATEPELEPEMVEEPAPTEVVEEDPVEVETEETAEPAADDGSSEALDDMGWPGEEPAAAETEEVAPEEPAGQQSEADSEALDDLAWPDEEAPAEPEDAQPVSNEEAATEESDDAGSSALDDLAWPE